MSKKHVTRVEFQGRDASGAATRSFTGNLQNANSAISQAVGKYGALAASAAAVGLAVYKAGQQAYRFVDQVAKLGDAMDKVSARTGVAVEEFGKWDFAVRRGGGSAADTENFIRRLSRSMADNRDGVKEATDAWARLGISTDQLVRGDGSLRSISEVMPLVADGMQRITAQADRMDIASAIGGRGGTKLLPMLQEGRKGLAAMADEMERYGGAMSTDFAGKSAEFVDAQTNMANAVDRLKESLTAPFLGGFTDRINSWAETLGKISSSPAFKFIQRANEARARTMEDLRQQAAEGTGQSTGGAYTDWASEGYRMPGEGFGPAPRNASVAGEEWQWGGAQHEPWWRRTSVADSLMDVDGQGDLERGYYNPLDGLMDTGTDGMLDGLSSGMAEINTEVEKFSSTGLLAAESFAWAMTTAFDDILFRGKDVADALGDMFKDAAGGILSGLFRLGVGLGLNALAPGLGSAIGFAPAARAAGGPVSAGQPYVVGERQPELFVPSSSGTIVPQVGGGGQYNITINAGSLGSDDPLALRRLAERLQRELERVQGYHYAGGAA